MHPVLYRKLALRKPLSALNKDWLARILAAGGSRPSVKTFRINDEFYRALLEAGLTSKVTVVNLFAPDSLVAAYTPLIQGSGSAVWVDTGSNGTIADLTINGLKRSAGGGNNRFIETNIFPGTGLMTSGTGHGSIYVSEDPLNGNPEIEFGVLDITIGGTNDFRMYAHWNDGNTYGSIFSQTHFLTATISALALQGYFNIVRTTTTASNLYFANSTNAHASKASDTTLQTLAPATTQSLALLAFKDQSGAITLCSAKRISAFTCGLGLTAAESLALYNAIQTARMSWGGGFQ
jgi:hypothetical protein